MHTQIPDLTLPEEILAGNLALSFEALARQHANKLAIADAEDTLTFDQLNRAANRLAHRLLALGLDLGEPVTLLLGHNRKDGIGILGVLKAGGAFTALLPSDPPAWQNSVLADLECRFLVVEDQTAAQGQELAGARAIVINLDRLHEQSEHNPGRSIPADTIASIYYTSGSTGKPKGGLRDHQAYLYRIWLEQQLFPRRPEDRASILFAYRFHAFVPGFIINLFNAVSVHFYDLQEQGLHNLSEWLQTQQISMFQITASALDAWLDMLAPQAFFPYLRYVRPTQRFRRASLERLWPHLPQDCVVLHRLAGTEAGVVTHQILTRATALESEVVPVGWPAPTVELFLQNEDGQAVAPGETGEIVIRSRFLIRGYWKRPQETDQRFRRDPQDPRYQFYYSGDLGRLRPDGCLELLGRKDQMLKVRGFRVEPGEIEHHLLQHPHLTAAAVVGLPVSDEDKFLVAYLVSQRQSQVEGGALRAFLLERLPEHMVPAHFVFLPELPLTSNGKLDRRRLPPVDLESAEPDNFAAPASALETTLAGIWAEVLERQQISTQADFYELGGNSLQATRIIARYRQLSGVEIPLREFFATGTIQALAQYLERQSQAADQPPAPIPRRRP